MTGVLKRAFSLNLKHGSLNQSSRALMAVIKVPLVLVLLVLTINRCHVESKSVQSKAPEEAKQIMVKRAIDPLSLLGLAVSVSSDIQGAVCTFTDVCGGDELIQKLEEIEKKLGSVQSDVLSIKKDVEDIWSESKRKWFFEHIKYISDERKNVIRDLKNKDNSANAKHRRELFINDVLGGAENDEHVAKGLFHISGLVTKDGLVTHYFDVQIKNGKSTTEAAKLTWIFIRKLFRYQEDGYASVVLAASMKYKNHEASYNTSMSEVCTWWPKSRDPEYEKFCDKFIKGPRSHDRRRQQQDFIFAMKDLADIPVQLVQTDCSKFTDSDTLLYSTGYLYVTQPVAQKILIVNRETLDIVNTIDVPGSHCGGHCHPFGIAIKAEDKVMAVAAKSTLSGGESKVMMFKIKGKLEEPSGISIEHYYTMEQLLETSGRKEADVRGVAFCGGRFAYADYNGVIRNWKMPNELYMGWNNGQPEPDLGDRYNWYLNRERNDYKSHQYYLSCSNSGKYMVVEKTESPRDWKNESVAAVPSDFTGKTGDVFEFAQIVVRRSDWHDLWDSDMRARMVRLKGTAMDTKGNLFYSSERNGMVIDHYSVSGVYQRRYDGKRLVIREWNRNREVKMFGMAVDDSGFLFSVQKDGSGSKCLHKFHHEIDFEDINKGALTRYRSFVVNPVSIHIEDDE